MLVSVLSKPKYFFLSLDKNQSGWLLPWTNRNFSIPVLPSAQTYFITMKSGSDIIMSGIEKTCTIIGMRPCKLPGNLDQSNLVSKIDFELRRSIFLGYRTFQTGMALGIDIWSAELVLKLRKEFPGIRLCCCLPCETQAERWPNAWREKYFDTLAESDDVICLQTQYSAGCMQRRNHFMIDGSTRLIAVYDGTSGGEAAQAIQYAKQLETETVLVNPLDFVRETDYPVRVLKG
ncbi:hypothetical protein SDC9_49811 [bioreactor metagenome]|uniref:DUF1273 domain-containing protein n=1 Tax=bioreactor metagenome TaxID=1076179 RepID=A0A644WMU8_9ZZZZ